MPTPWRADGKMRLHFVSLPHVALGTEITCLCAYSARSEKFAKMLGDSFEIFMYAPDGPDIRGATLVPCLSDARRQDIFGKDDPFRLPNWPTDEQTVEFNENVVRAMHGLIEPRDLILLSAGWTHKIIYDAFPAHIRLEPGVGYSGILPDSFCAFESWANLNHVYAKRGINDVRFFDRVIPNSFDPDEFPIVRSRPGDYLLCVSRVIARKGLHVASQIAEAAGLPLRIAGAGGKQVGPDIQGLDILIKNAEYLGPVGVTERNRLMSEARALLVPTLYSPAPFEGVSIEANFSGCPSITTNQGAFTETITNGVNGFRFDTLKEAVKAVNLCGYLNGKGIKDHAMERFSLPVISKQFTRWFSALETLWDKGWYSL